MQKSKRYRDSETLGRRQKVFLNVPFDSGYENLFVALIAGVTAMNLAPRCVLEIRTTTDRLNRILQLISECQYSIHDLSRVQLDPRAPRCPRFNMPFELGLTLAGIESLGRTHHWVVLEEKPYRLQKSLSDLNGYDPFVHHGTVTGVLQALLDAFENATRRVSIAEMKSAFDALRIVADQLKLTNELPNLYRAAAFRQLVLAAATLRRTGAQALRSIPD